MRTGSTDYTPCALLPLVADLLDSKQSNYYYLHYHYYYVPTTNEVPQFYGARDTQIRSNFIEPFT